MTGASDLLGLRDRRALVTGGSRGVGRAVTLAMGSAGARTGFTYRGRDEAAGSTLRELKQFDADAWSYRGDLSEEEVVGALRERVVQEFSELDVLVLNHGVWEPRDVPLWEMAEEQWHHTLSSNLHSVFLLVRALLPRLSDGGSVVVVTSTAAQRGEAFHGDYAASKGALQSLVKGVAVEVAPRGIRVNAVAPGWIRTEMAAPAFEGGALEEILRRIPLGRVAEPEDVAGPILFLASRLARHVTGEVLNVNGGAVRPG